MDQVRAVAGPEDHGVLHQPQRAAAGQGDRALVVGALQALDATGEGGGQVLGTGRRRRDGGGTCGGGRPARHGHGEGGASHGDGDETAPQTRGSRHA